VALWQPAKTVDTQGLVGGAPGLGTKSLFDCICRFTGPFQVPKGCRVASHPVSFGPLLLIPSFLLIEKWRKKNLTAESVLGFAFAPPLTASTGSRFLDLNCYLRSRHSDRILMIHLFSVETVLYSS
jgi:hypothetical protein